MLRAILLMAAMLSASVAAAQSRPAIVTGLVSDDAHTGLPARVAFVSETTRFELTAGPDGLFHAEMPAGTYTVRVTMDGFVTSELSGLTLDVGDRVDLQAPLRVAGVNDTPVRDIGVLRLPTSSS